MRTGGRGQSLQPLRTRPLVQLRACGREMKNYFSGSLEFVHEPGRRGPTPGLRVLLEDFIPMRYGSAVRAHGSGISGEPGFLFGLLFKGLGARSWVLPANSNAIRQRNACALFQICTESRLFSHFPSLAPGSNLNHYLAEFRRGSRDRSHCHHVPCSATCRHGPERRLPQESSMCFRRGEAGGHRRQ